MNKLRDVKTFGIVLASGSGTRFGSAECPKHLIEISGVPSVVWTINTLIDSRIFDKIVVVTREKDLDRTKDKISHYHDIKDHEILFSNGGSQRIDSFINGVLKISQDTQINNKDLITLIDANRPLCSTKQLLDLSNLAITYGCSCLSRPIVNGVAKISSNRITEVPNKDDYQEFVTPEFIRYELFEQSKHKKLKSLVEHSLYMSVKPGIISSSDLNTKLTYREDLIFLEQLVVESNISIPKKII
jgi:2-C-methyl-D-erythritol 4-phosphate cytidylyltransferase